MEPDPSIWAWNAASTRSFSDLCAVFLETCNSHTAGASQARAVGDAKYSAGGRMLPTSSRRASAQSPAAALVRPAGWGLLRGAWGLQLLPERGSMGLCWETNAVGAGGLGGSLEIPPWDYLFYACCLPVAHIDGQPWLASSVTFRTWSPNVLGGLEHQVPSWRGSNTNPRTHSKSMSQAGRDSFSH